MLIWGGVVLALQLGKKMFNVGEDAQLTNIEVKWYDV